MAGDWIPIRENLCSVREVVAISRATGMSRFEVVGRLVAFWDWAQRETADGRLVDVDVDALVDTHATHESFWRALISQSWLKEVSEEEIGGDIRPWSGLLIPNFENWLSGGAKARLQKNKRQKDWRGKVKNVDGHVDGHVEKDASTTASTTVPDRTGPVKKEEDPPLSPLNGGREKEPDKKAKKPTDLKSRNHEKVKALIAARSGIWLQEKPTAELRRWMRHRFELGKPLSPTSIERLLSKYALNIQAFYEAVDFTIEKGWQGLVHPSEQARGGKPQKSLFEKNAEFLREKYGKAGN
jgi:hypothetical protein